MGAVKTNRLFTALCYIGFLGLFGVFYAGDAAVARHGRRGLILFVGEVLVFVLADIARIRLGLNFFAVFVPLGVAVAVAKMAIIVNALAGKGGDVTVKPY